MDVFSHRQSPPAWSESLLGSSDMGVLIRAHDWSGTPLGLLEGWSQSLKTTLSLMLGAHQPIAVYWGEDLVFLYNDAYRLLIGDKHPAALGRPARDVFPEAWPIIGSTLTAVLETGEAGTMERHHVLLNRHGALDDGWFDYAISAVRGENGTIEGLFNPAHEVTAAVKAERERDRMTAALDDAHERNAVLTREVEERTRLEERLQEREAQQAFLLRLGDALRELGDDAGAMMTLATAALAKQLDVPRVGYAGVDEAVEYSIVAQNYNDTSRVPDITALRDRLDDYGPPIIAEIRAGRVMRVDDLATDPRTAGAAAEMHAVIGVRATLAAPVQRQGHTVAFMFAHHDAPRRWTDDDAELLRQATERTWAAVERAQGAERLRESEGRYRTLFEMMAEGFCIIEKTDTAPGEASDFRYLAANPAFERQAGVDNPVGKTIRDILPDIEPLWLDTYDKVVQTGKSVRLDSYLAAIARSLEVYAFRTGMPQERQLGVIFTDITQRKEAEEAQRQRVVERALEAQLSEQRRRLGRELHDGLRQELVGIQMLSASLYKQLEARAAPEATMMHDFSGLISDANMQVRHLINGLVPVTIDAESLLPALERAAVNIEQWYGLACSVRVQETVALQDDKTVNHLFYIAQEAMTNAAKHSKASQIDVSLALAGETLTLTVRDDGRGLPKHFDKRGGMGLSNLRYRAELIGAQLSFDSKPAAGTVVSCVLSLL